MASGALLSETVLPTTSGLVVVAFCPAWKFLVLSLLSPPLLSAVDGDSGVEDPRALSVADDDIVGAAGGFPGAAGMVLVGSDACGSGSELVSFCRGRYQLLCPSIALIWLELTYDGRSIWRVQVEL